MIILGGRGLKGGRGSGEDVKLTFSKCSIVGTVAVERNSRREKLITLRRWVKPILKWQEGDGGNRIKDLR